MRKISSDMITQACMLSLFTIGFYMLSTSAGHAASVGDILCTLFTQLQSDVGRGVATLAVASLGVSALVGKVSWGMAIMVAVGIAVLFGAQNIVSLAGATPCP